jgi:hypothetical protein
MNQLDLSSELDAETLERTMDACAWLLPIAQLSDEDVAAWLDRIGTACFKARHGEVAQMTQ